MGARVLGVALVVALVAAPFVPMAGMRQYTIHVLVQILIWSFIGGAWALMGRFGLTSLGHGAFLGLGAYTTTLLWNAFGLTPWLGAGVVEVADIGFPPDLVRTELWLAERSDVAQLVRPRGFEGHKRASGTVLVVAGSRGMTGAAILCATSAYRAGAGLVTLAVGEVVRLLIIAERDWTGGSLGLTVKPAAGDSLLAVQFADRRVFYYGALVLWLGGLGVWRWVDRSMARSAMEAIGEDETAAASVGIHVTRFKVGITVLSAMLTAIGGIAYAQYISYVNPDTLAGIGVSLRIVFAVVLGGMYSLLGPTVGTALTIALAEYLRVLFGLKFIGMAETIYGLVLVIIIIFLPSGIYGSLRGLLVRRRTA